MKSLVTAALILLTTSSAKAAAFLSVEKAMQASQATGRPILAVAGRTNCPACRRIASQLDKDPRARRVASVYVLLKLDVGDRKEFPKWVRKYKFKGGAIPAVWVVRADGKQLFAGNGAPRDLVKFLVSHLPTVGKLLPRAQLARLTKAAEQIQSLHKSGEVAKVVPLLKRYGSSGSFSSPAVAIKKIAANLATDAKKQLEAAQTKLMDPMSAAEGAKELLAVRDRFGKLMPIGKQIGEAIRSASRDAKTKQLLIDAAKK